MNYLAHSFLSFTDEQIVGQFLNDFIPNKDRLLLPKAILEGVILHRKIDSFTDSHPAISEAKKVFSPLVRLYAGAFVDVAMDYFLANDTTIYSQEQWKTHAEKVYRVLENHLEFFPEKFKLILQKMREDNWLYHYREVWGIEFSMKNVQNKAKYLDKNLPVFPLFLNHKVELNDCYQQFFPDLQRFIQLENNAF
jgi:acyl carrier protein phosphodiesterase